MKKAGAERWREENCKANESWNRRAAKHGLPSAKYQNF
ncbi:MAG: type II toxin-antitoxin system CcdA family antitoxin [Alphaproteobacteria bacterium]